VHSVASIEKRIPLFEAFLENGVNWTRRPIHAFVWKQDAEKLPLTEYIYWDCFSSYVDVQVRARMSGLRADLISISGVKRKGTYQFTLDWAFENRSMLDTNFSETPEHKCGHVFKMDNGNYFIYPNNRIIWMDNAWTYNRIDKNPGYQIDMSVYSIENKTNYETDYNYITEFKKEEVVNEEVKLDRKIKCNWCNKNKLLSDGYFLGEVNDTEFFICTKCNVLKDIV
jgi:hypothetical protein